MTAEPGDRDATANPTPVLWLWGVFFACAAVLAFLVQLVLLPYVFTAWHAGNGLLAGGDWLSFHRFAADLAEKIHAQGWSAWELRPDGQAPAGIAGAIYALTLPQPWTVIPVNAALHATAGVVLLRLVQVFVPDWRLAVWSVLPFLLYPSAMTWYTQMHKEGYSIAGSFLFVYGWVSLARPETWRSGWRPPLRAVLWVFLGAALAWIVRPYLVQMMQGVGAILSLLLTGAFLARAARAMLPWRKALAASMLVWVALVLITPLTRGGFAAEVPSGEAGAPPPAGATEPGMATAEEPVITVAWERSAWLPASLDDKLYALAVIRKAYRIRYPDAGSNIDIDKEFHNVREIVAYIPRALQIAFLSPFPKQWLERSSLGVNTVMRRVSALETAGVYLALAFLPYAVWRWRRRVELWVILAFSTGMMLIFGLVVPNIGTMYRVRYGYIMVLVALGIAAGIAAWQESRLSRRSRR